MADLLRIVGDIISAFCIKKLSVVTLFSYSFTFCHVLSQDEF